jgi:ketosteroid isomerase-like protein
MSHESSEPADEVRALIESVYAGYLLGDSESIDAHLLDDVTMFDSSALELVEGLAGLADLRRRRVEAGAATDDRAAATETALTVTELTARQVGDVIVAAWWLRVDGNLAGAPIAPELSRNTAVLLRRNGALRIAHLHEDVRQPLGGPIITRP